jgi:hypothetical protein
VCRTSGSNGRQPACVGVPLRRAQRGAKCFEWDTANVTAALEALLPDRWLADHPEHRLKQWEGESREAQARRRRKRAARRVTSAG